MIRVFIGFDPSEIVSYHVLSHSIMKHASEPVGITPLNLANLKNIMVREMDELQSTEFSFSRFIVPYLCDYEGFAIFMDCDMLFLDDIAGLWKLRDERYAVQVVKHDHKPVEKTKFLGNQQLRYEMKNWSSVMLFNNGKCQNLTKDYVNSASGLELHQFKWLAGESDIGALPGRWNYLVDSRDNGDEEDIGNLHYTVGGPYFSDFRDCDFSREWWDAFHEMTSCENPAEGLKAPNDHVKAVDNSI